MKRCFLGGLLAAVLIGCGGQGTEVLSPSNPIDTPGPQKLESVLYEILLVLPEGWSFVEYGPGVEPNPETFDDIDPETVVAAHFTHGTSGFTIFYSVMTEGQSLENFVRERRPEGEIVLQAVEGVDGAVIAVFTQQELGPHDGLVFDTYISVESDVLWMRAELVGTEEEIQQILDEFNGIVNSIEFVPKGGGL